MPTLLLGKAEEKIIFNCLGCGEMIPQNQTGLREHYSSAETFVSSTKSMIQFLSARSLSGAEIHQEIFRVYSDTVMSESKVDTQIKRWQ